MELSKGNKLIITLLGALVGAALMSAVCGLFSGGMLSAGALWISLTFFSLAFYYVWADETLQNKRPLLLTIAACAALVLASCLSFHRFGQQILGAVLLIAALVLSVASALQMRRVGLNAQFLWWGIALTALAGLYWLVSVNILANPTISA